MAKRAYLLVILLLFGIFPLSNSSGSSGLTGPFEFSFNTPTNLKTVSTQMWIDDGIGDVPQEWREGLDVDSDGTVSTDEVENWERDTETSLTTQSSVFSLNDVFAERQHLLIDMNDAEGPTNSSKPLNISHVSTMTFDVSPDLDEYIFTTWYDVDEVFKDGMVMAPHKVTVPEGYKITKVDGVKANNLSNSDRTITITPIDNIVVVFEKENSLLSSTSIIPALISIGLIALFRRK